MTIKELEDLIRYHQDLYYNSQPEISDADFDVLWDELKKRDPGNSLFKNVGHDSSDGWPKGQHIMMMGSQNKAANEGDFNEWLKKHKSKEYLVQYKLDGASLELQYESGRLVYAITRGDGQKGDIITQNALKMNGVPAELPNCFSGAVRGEVLMSHDVHKNLFSDKANCRNAANGLMKRKDGVGVEHLTVICYDVLGDEEFDLEQEKMAFLSSNGFNAVHHEVLKAEEIIPYRAKVASERDNLPFDIDGLVIKTPEVDPSDLSLARPEKQIAFKFELEEALTTLIRVDWSESGSHFTPIAIVEPVRLAGTNVQKASLCNMNLVRELNLKIGSQVIMTKRGEIIPKLERVISTPENAPDIFIPSKCSCGADLIDEGTFLYCPNEKCSKKVLHMVQRWVATLGIKNLGENLLTRLVEMGRVQEINDLYTLTKSELASLDRMGDSSSEKVLRNLHSVSEVTLPQFIAGFDIEGIGESTIEKAEEAGLDSLDKLRNAKIDELQQVNGIGPETAQVLYNGLRAKYSQMDQLLCHTPLKIKGKIQGGKLTGQSFCFTGELHSMKRSAAEEMVKALGGSISSVKKGLTALVTNDPNSGSEKNKKAQSLGIKIISEDDFLEMVK